MSNNYSQKLIQKCRKVVRKKSGKRISMEKAELVLDQLARLGTLAIKTFNEPNNLISNKNRHEKNNSH